MTNPIAKASPISFRIIERPARKLLLKRGVQAQDYFAYCGEVGCDVWEELKVVEQTIDEPAGYWLPPRMIEPGTSRYVQGVELPSDYLGDIPEGCDLIDLPAGQWMVFQSQPYLDEDYQTVIAEVWRFVDNFDPTMHGYRFALDSAPRLQYEPQGARGYIEAWPVEENNN